MATFLPKGEHVVEMSAHSLYFAKAAWVSFITIFLLCSYWSLVLIAKRKQQL
jgi:hypothetical protein